MPKKTIPSFAEKMPDLAVPEDTPAPPFGVLLADYFEQPPGYSVRRAAGTRDWLITYTTGGEGRYRLGGAQVPARPGDVVLLAPGAPHDYATVADQPPGADAPWCFFWAHFIPRAGWLVWLKLPPAGDGLSTLSIRGAETRERVAAAFRRLVEAGGERRPFGAELAANALEEALILIARQGQPPAPRFSDPRVDQAQGFLETHYQQPLSLQEIAARVALSPWRLAHLYKQQTGQTILQSLTQLRLQQAARLLAYTSRTVAEIAADVGFESPFYFSRLFKRAYGQSPLQFRGSVNSER
jgi:AraC family transcriptional regulator of arabinose operon